MGGRRRIVGRLQPARGRQKHGVRTLPSRVSSILKGSFSKSVSTRQAGECGSPAGVYPHVLRGMRRPGERGNLEGYLQGQVRHPSVACGDTSPCRGGFWGGGSPEWLPCKGSWIRRKAQTEGCIAALWRKYPLKPGSALPPCFAGCVAAGRVRQPGRVLPRQGAAPLRRLRRRLPLQGRLPGRQRTKRLPCKGSWMRRKAQTEGCIAGWRWKYPLKLGRVLPYVS